ncbi:deoxyguanosinetriphosphate triphosphohydrolase [Clostridium sp. MSJ-8]|uniref:deoxyguanosinetriphosphate triphosphohydrolase n=1 Tax=Clostridium sp. MSJ-8 TaxID=2841510 RepID=UPI001C0E9CFD|nr:deoxyguanosinetriphosphate triphosphohydrolase [Clostridium sp. MSJ-8]MBU5486629.1 deoxyguanosinetriphosphate triphosphohydrolase [Clostridium sp. MSJ-8]
MNYREKIESFEKLTLIKEATFSGIDIKREKKEEAEELRTCFMIDRDRIIHSKSFRRLKHKTQVYINTFGDHYRTRLTHTLEVSQVARTIAVGIGLNEILVEAIALGHDLGHVAFAHNGEAVLNDYLEEGFRHNEQSVRVVTKLENNGRGLNLTEEVIDGILNHSGLRDSDDLGGAKTLEGKVVQYSDKIAYINHDIDDSIRARLLNRDSIPKDILEILGYNHSERINTLVMDIINNSLNNIKKGIVNISLSSEIDSAMRKLRKFMFKNVYLSEELKEERRKASFVLEQLLSYFEKNVEKLPPMYKNIAEEEGDKRGIVDYISGMSDDYCLSMFNKIYVPKIVVY